MSKKKLHQADKKALLTDFILTGDKEQKNLHDYITESQSEGEGTLPEFEEKITSGGLDIKYIESVDLGDLGDLGTQFAIKDGYALKWCFDTETFIQEVINDKMVGITKPTFFFGRKYAAFPWHREDADLRSLSYLIAGSPKVC